MFLKPWKVLYALKSLQYSECSLILYYCLREISTSWFFFCIYYLYSDNVIAEKILTSKCNFLQKYIVMIYFLIVKIKLLIYSHNWIRYKIFAVLPTSIVNIQYILPRLCTKCIYVSFQNTILSSFNMIWHDQHDLKCMLSLKTSKWCACDISIQVFDLEVTHFYCIRYDDVWIRNHTSFSISLIW